MSLPDTFWNMNGPQVGLIRRTWQRFGWRIVFQWLIVTTAIGMLIYDSSPTFEAMVLLKFSPSVLTLGTDKASEEDLPSLLKAQERLLKSSAVLSAALAELDNDGIPMFVGVGDREAALREKIRFRALPRSYLFEIILGSEISVEAMDLSRVVIRNYLVAAEKAFRKSTKERIDELEKRIQTQKADIASSINEEQIGLARDRLVAAQIRLEELRFQSNLRQPLISTVASRAGTTRSGNRKTQFLIGTPLVVFLAIFGVSMWRERSLGVSGLLKSKRLEPITSI